MTASALVSSPEARDMMTGCVLVIGKHGQVASALARCRAGEGLRVVCCGRPELDLLDLDSLNRAIHNLKPSVIVNAAAYTAVDKAESEPELAYRLNAAAPGHLALLCAGAAIPLIHISTDYVFDGEKRTPYGADDPLRPINIYGATKAAGEDAIRVALPRHLILRTAWVYSGDGHNFFKTMLRLAQEREVVRVVDDQHGSPTYAADIAQAVMAMADAALRRENLWGTYHFTNAGQTTWHGFAAKIFRLAAANGLPAPHLEAIPTSSYPTPARRPAYSVLDSASFTRQFGIVPPSWQDGLHRCFQAHSGANAEGSMA